MLSEVIVGMDERMMKDVTGHVLYFLEGKIWRGKAVLP